MAEFAIQTRGLTRTFAQVLALDNLDLEVPAGSIFGFLGTSGAGKTTTIRLSLGLIEPTGGSASVLGFDTRTQSDEIRTRAGALLEHSGLYERMSAEDNLRFFRRVARMPKPQLEERIRELLTHLGLWDRRKEAVVKWSRGMKQKLAIARPLLHNPALVFLDEPTTGPGSGSCRKPSPRPCRPCLAPGRYHLPHHSQHGWRMWLTGRARSCSITIPQLGWFSC